MIFKKIIIADTIYPLDNQNIPLKKLEEKNVMDNFVEFEDETF